MAKRSVRFVLRRKGTKASRIKSCYVKPSAKLRPGGGVKGVLKLGGVGGGKVLVWKTIDGRWSGDKAAEMYTTVIKPALKKHYPKRAKFTLLEDNDPTGNMSKKGIAAKAAGNMEVLRIPKRSPDLNVLDYAIWSEVERRMRKGERNMKTSRRETRAAFEKRLDRTALALPASFINKAVGNMRERTQRLYKAKGGLFEEGGRSKRPL